MPGVDRLKIRNFVHWTNKMVGMLLNKRSVNITGLHNLLFILLTARETNPDVLQIVPEDQTPVFMDQPIPFQAASFFGEGRRICLAPQTMESSCGIF